MNPTAPTLVPAPRSAVRLTQLAPAPAAPAAPVPGPSLEERLMLAGPVPVARSPVWRRPHARPPERRCVR